jgi:virginiamycin B lyase
MSANPKRQKRNARFLAAFIVVITATGAVAWFKRSLPGADIVEYAMANATDIPTAIAVGPDGTAWFTIDFADAIGIIRNGKIERLPTGKKNLEPVGLAVDASGAAWYTDAPAVRIARITPAGEITSVPLGTPIARLARLAAGADGTVWFAESTRYGFTRLKNGVLTRYVAPSVRGGPYGIALDQHGNAWGTLQSGNRLVRISTTGEITEFEVPTPGSSPTDVVVDGAGSVWFLEFRGNKIGKFADGKFSEFPLPGNLGGLSGLAATSDGAVWFGILRDHSLGRLRDGTMTIIALPRTDARPYTLAADKAGNIWYADISGYVGIVRADSVKK